MPSGWPRPPPVPGHGRRRTARRGPSPRTVSGPCRARECRRRSRRQLRCKPAPQPGEVLVERHVVEIDAPFPPELLLDRLGLRPDRPGSVADPLAAPDAMEEDPQAPRVEWVAEEEEVAAPELRGQRHRQDDGDLGL